MGLFSRRLSAAHLPIGATLEVQVWNDEVFDTVRDGKQTFSLEREPKNRADKNAIRVNCSEGWVGYLNADDARNYAKTLDQIPVPVFVQAVVKKGQAVIGVPRPKDLQAWVSRQRFAR